MNYFNQAIKTLQNWIKIKSVKSSPEKDMPFGKGVYDSLALALSDGEKLGFKTVNYDNYIGEIVFGDGDDKNGLAILCHLDVVPEGEHSFWNYPPYEGVIDNGAIYGRGVIDDKGPAVLCLYALKELKDNGFKPSKKIKLILGCDEESGWDCIERSGNRLPEFNRAGFQSQCLADGRQLTLFGGGNGARGGLVRQAFINCIGLFQDRQTPLQPFDTCILGVCRVVIVQQTARAIQLRHRQIKLLDRTEHGLRGGRIESQRIVKGILCRRKILAIGVEARNGRTQLGKTLLGRKVTTVGALRG